MSTIGHRIKAQRKALGLRQVELARAIGITQGSLSDIERGETQIPAGNTLTNLARELRVTEAWIMTVEDGTLLVPSPEGQAILNAYERMTPAQQAAVRALMESFTASPAPAQPTLHAPQQPYRLEQ